MGKSPRRGKGGDGTGGFTILEAMMAATVMLFAISTSITTMQRAFQSIDSARNLTVAAQILQMEKEKMRMCNWATVTAYPASPTLLTLDPSFTSNPKIGTRFTVERSASIVAGSPNLLQLTYTISWRNYDGRLLARSNSTYYSRYGIYDYLYNTT